MAVFFNGWLGYGTIVQAGILSEPVDPGYQRRPYVLGDMNSGIVSDVGSGTVGPSTVSWGSIGYQGLFDAQTAGNLLAWLPLRVPLSIGIGNTIESGSGVNKFHFPDLARADRSVYVWPAGAPVARTFDGRSLTAGVSLQVVNGQLSAQAPMFGNAVTMASLPNTQQAAGSGLLWNNGGIASIS